MKSRLSHLGAIGVALALVAAAPYSPAAAQAVDAPGLETALIRSGDPRENWFSVFAPDGKTLATGGAGGVLKLWDLASGIRRSASPPSRDRFRCGAFAPNGQTVATGRLSGTVTVWDARSAKPLKTVKGHSASIRSVSFSPDGKRLVTSGQDRRLTVWETATWTAARSLSEQPQPILSSAFSADGKLLATTSQAAPEPAQLWHLSTAMALRAMKRVGDARTLAYARDGTALAVGQLDGTISVFEPANGRLVAASRGHVAVILGLDFSSDGKLLATASADATVKIWDLSSTTGTAGKK